MVIKLLKVNNNLGIMQRDAKVDKARDIEQKLKEARVQLEQEKERADKIRAQVKEVSSPVLYMQATHCRPVLTLVFGI